MKRLALGLVCFGALLLGGPAAAQNTIKVGVPMPLSGPARALRRAGRQGRAHVRRGDQRGGRRARQEDRARGARQQGIGGRGRARVARDDPQGGGAVPGRHVDLGRGPGGLDHRQGEQDHPDRADPQDRSADRREEPAPLRVPHRRQHHHGRPLGGRDHRHLEGREEGCNHRATTMPTGRTWRSPSSTTSRSCAPTSRSSTSSGRSSARPTTRPSSMRRWPRSPRPCSPPCGAATS